MKKSISENFFKNISYEIEANTNLREPQIEAYIETKKFFDQNQNGHVILQLPVGCGKTGLMSILPFGICKTRVLVIVPNLEILRGVTAEFNISLPNCFLRRAKIITSFNHGPFSAILEGKKANISDCEKSHIVITNIQQLASKADRWLPNFPENFFDLILVDEGHHNVAQSWMKVFEKFQSAKIISLTATPVRGDGQKISGNSIYRYPFSRAMLKGYIKQVISVSVAPTEISFTYKGDNKKHSLEEIVKLREKDWFSKGVALARECNISIVDASIQWLEHLRATGTKHQIIAVACTVDHAREIRSLYSERSYECREIYSEMQEQEKEDIIRELKNGKLDCIVQVAMLGEGFDHPLLSVAAIFRPYKSLSPYVQFVGRIMRVVHQNSPGHPDNEGVIISHIGLNIDRHWDDFKEFDKDDQQVIDKWLHSETITPNIDERRRKVTRPRITPDMVVLNEIIEKFITQDFIDPSDEAILDQLVSTIYQTTGFNPDMLGLSKDDLRRRILSARKKAEIVPEKKIVNPQKQRQQTQKRLDEKLRSLANKILFSAGLQVNAPQLLKYFPSSGATNNYAVAIQLINKKVLEITKCSRDQLTIEQYESLNLQLESIADSVQQLIQEKLGK